MQPIRREDWERRAMLVMFLILIALLFAVYVGEKARKTQQAERQKTSETFAISDKN